MGNVVPIKPARKPRKRPTWRPETLRRRLLAKLVRQAAELPRRGRPIVGSELADLLLSLRAASPRARFLSFYGLRFEIWHSFTSRWAVYPDANRPGGALRLIGVRDL